MSKKGFTLIELMVVVIIVGILASLAIGNYARVVEKGRSAEAKKIISLLRQLQGAYYLEQDKFETCLTRLGFMGPITSSGSAAYYFYYNGSEAGGTSFNISAVRCTGTNGKQPGGADAYMIKINEIGTITCNDSRYQ